jgi:hypothetical protein
VLNVEEEFKLDEVMAEEVKELFRKEERLAQVGSSRAPVRQRGWARAAFFCRDSNSLACIWEVLQHGYRPLCFLRLS